MTDSLDIFNPFGGETLDKFQVAEYRASVSNFCNTCSNENNTYQVVILGAGQGTRMEIDYPKVLYNLEYPGGSSSLLSNTLAGIQYLKKVVDINDIHLIVDETAQHYYTEKYCDNEINIIGLPKADIRGTAVSINAIKNYLNPSNETIILWGDLALWRVSDLSMVLNVQSSVNSCLTFSTRVISQPYVAFLRTAEGNIYSVVHANESQRYPGIAEQDCLSFVCNYEALEHLDHFIGMSQPKGEIDFVHFIPYLSSKGLSVVAMPIAQPDTIFGLNTPKRANEINNVLSRYSNDAYIEFFMNPQW